MKKLLYIIIFLYIGEWSNAQNIKINPPSIDPIPITEDYFGLKITDEYRNLEDVNDTIVSEWYKKENQYAESILNSITGVENLKNRMKEINNRQEFYVKMINILENGNLFYLKKDKVDNIYKLFYRKQFSDEEILLYNPKNFKPETNENYSINYIKPSWEGDYIIISLSYSGKEISELLIFDVNKGIVLPNILDKAWPSSFLGISWLPDSSGFIFLQFPITDNENNEFKKNTQSVLYKIGDDVSNLRILINSKLFSTLNIKPNEYPIVTLGSKNDPFLIAYIATVENFWDAYYLPIEELKDEILEWKPFYKSDDKVYTDLGIFYNGDYIYKSALKSPNFNISKVSLESKQFESPKVLVPQKKEEGFG